MDKDVTNQVEFNLNDDEFLPIIECICGAEFGYWEFVISVYEDDACSCPECGAKLYFRNSIRVFQVSHEPLIEKQLTLW